MSVWLTIPSARPPAEANPVLQKWRERGYKIALWCDRKEDAETKAQDWWQANSTDVRGRTDTYPGYAEAVNHLIACVLEIDPAAEWFVAAGDDVLPDPNHSAEEIAAQCADHFAVLGGTGHCRTFGVMQPTGDRFGQSPHFHPFNDRGDGIACGCGYLKSHPVHTGGAYIDRVAGSAWYGREYCKRMYGGGGPLWPEYRHMFVDQEARDVAVKMGVYWERPDLNQHHDHWSRTLGKPEPEFLKKASAGWDEAKAIYEARATAGFPGSEPL